MCHAIALTFPKAGRWPVASQLISKPLPWRGGMMRWVGFCLLAIFLATGQARADEHATVSQKPPTITTRLFDKSNPPAEMPPLTGSEAAQCQYDLACEASTGYSMRDNGVQTKVTITDVQVTIRLKIVIWLPNNYTPKLKAHEEGHSTISQIVYKPSAELAKTMAAKLVGMSFTIPSGGAKEAATQRANELAKEMCSQWLKQVGGDARKVNDAFDDITAHGTKAIDVPAAIDQAIEKSGVKKAE